MGVKTFNRTYLTGSNDAPLEVKTQVVEDSDDNEERRHMSDAFLQGLKEQPEEIDDWTELRSIVAHQDMVDDSDYAVIEHLAGLDQDGFESFDGDEEAVRRYFTLGAFRSMDLDRIEWTDTDEDGQELERSYSLTQGDLDEMAKLVIENRWHMRDADPAEELGRFNSTAANAAEALGLEGIRVYDEPDEVENGTVRVEIDDDPEGTKANLVVEVMESRGYSSTAHEFVKNDESTDSILSFDLRKKPVDPAEELGRFLEHHEVVDLLLEPAQALWDEGGSSASLSEEVVEGYFETSGPRIAKQLEENYIAEQMAAGIEPDTALARALAVDFLELVASSWDEFLEAVQRTEQG